MSRKFQPSPLALAILVLLHEAPMHPYRMQRLIKDRGKDQVINVEQRASLYQTINQLLHAGLITFWENSRQEGFPERTVYKLTESGRQTATAWLQEMLSTPVRDYPEFPAAISLLPLLIPADAMHQLERREDRLINQIASKEKVMQTYPVNLSRLFLLEEEYMLTMLEAELNWVRSLIADLRSGQITWDQEWMRQVVPPEAGETTEIDQKEE